MSHWHLLSDRIKEKIQVQAGSLGEARGQWLSHRCNSRWFPRDRQCARDFVIQKVADQPFFLYGAGSHSLALLEDLAGDPILEQLIGFLDGHARPGQTLAGYPVHGRAFALEHQAPILLSHHEFEDSMRRDLLAEGVDPQRIHPIYLDPAYGEMVLNRLIPELEHQLGRLNTSDRKRVVLVNARARRIIDDFAVSALAQDVAIIQIQMDRDNTTTAGDKDITRLDARNSIFLCCWLLERLRPDLVIVQEHYSSGNFLPLALGMYLPPRKLVAEFYDFLTLTFDDPYILSRESYWSPQDVDLALASETWCIQNIAGFITKEDGPVLDRWLAHPQVLKYQPCLSAASFQNKNTKPTDRPRLIWAGTIASSRLSPKMFGDNQLLDVFSDLVAAGFEVTARSSCRDLAELEAHYPDYLELMAGGHFQILTAIPRDQLISEMARDFDFGLMLGRPKAETQQGISHKVTVSAKIHSYLAAGLPVIVGSYLEVMADWVRRHRLGLVVSPDQIQLLPAMIRETDYSELLAAVRTYRKKYHLDGMSLQLRAFVADLSG